MPSTVLDRGTRHVDVFATTVDGPAETCFVCVHGLGGSHVNWNLLAPLLAAEGTVWAPDLAGFGYTSPTGRSASVDDNLDLLSGFVSTVKAGARRVVLVGNSMGGLLALRLAARRLDVVDAVVAIAPASPRPVASRVDREVLRNFSLSAVPFVGETWLALRARRVSAEQQVRDTLTLCTADFHALDPAQVQAHVDLARRRRSMPYARSAYLQAARTMLWTLGPGAPRLWRDLAAISAPVLLLSGGRDRLVTAPSIDGVARRNPNWTAIRYDELGHVPMLEDPTRVADDIREWLASPAGAARFGGGSPKVTQG